MAYTFLSAMGVATGNSLVETEKLDVAASLIEMEGFSDTVLLPADHVVGRAFSPDTEFRIVDDGHIAEGWQGLDIGHQNRCCLWRTDRFRKNGGMERSFGCLRI